MGIASSVFVEPSILPLIMLPKRCQTAKHTTAIRQRMITYSTVERPCVSARSSRTRRDFLVLSFYMVDSFSMNFLTSLAPASARPSCLMHPQGMGRPSTN